MEAIGRVDHELARVLRRARARSAAVGATDAVSRNDGTSQTKNSRRQHERPEDEPALAQVAASMPERTSRKPLKGIQRNSA